jgi:hypothetical protein
MSRSILRRLQPALRASLTGTLLVALTVACADDPVGVGPVAPNGTIAGDDIVVADATLTACGIGFWKNHMDSETWGPTGYAPDASVGSAFDGAEPYQDHTLAEALGLMGGRGVDGAKAILMRAGVGALLNAAHPDVDYPMGALDVLVAVSSAFDTGNRRTILALAEELDLLNDGTCGPESGEPGDPDLPDLIVERIVFTSADATTLSRTTTIKNVGTAPVDVNGVSVQGFYSADTNLDQGDAAAGGRSASIVTRILEPGESMDVPGLFALPEPEHVYLLMIVDYGETITESDETNNIGVAELPAG